MELGLCVEMVFADLPFEERLEKAAAAGLKNVEMWLVDRSWQAGPDALARVAERCGVRITNTVVGSPDGSVGGGLTDPAMRELWLERTRMTLDFNRAAGIPMTIVCTGNDVDGLTDEQMFESVVEGLKPTVELAEAANLSRM